MKYPLKVAPGPMDTFNIRDADNKRIALVPTEHMACMLVNELNMQRETIRQLREQLAS